MKVVILNTYDRTGGAAIAANRLTKTLLESNVSATMLVNVKTGSDDHVLEKTNSNLKRRFAKYLNLFEKVLFIPFEISKTERFSFSTARYGSSLVNHPSIQEADIIHLHWVNQSFLSYKNLDDLFKLNKPVVITMHDMWYITGGCHHARKCNKYQSLCGDCPLIKGNKEQDLSFKGFKTKQSIYSKNITFVAVSKWLADLAKKSSLLISNPVLNIPNPINVNVFNPKEKSKNVFGFTDDKIYILYAAAQPDNIRKGYKYLEESLHELYNSQYNFEKEIEIIIMGKIKDNSAINFPFKTHFLGNLTKEDEIVACYNSADLFIAPSLEENLPNTLIESMACGTPCVAFEIGGIPEIIDHKENGYIAEYKNASDLSEGIKWVLSKNDLKQSCIDKVHKKFSIEVVIGQFVDLYQKLLSKKD